MVASSFQRDALGFSPKSSRHGGEQIGKGGSSKQGGTIAQEKKAGRKGRKAAAKSS